MEAGKIKGYRVVLVVIAVLMLVFSIMDAMFFKMTSDSGLISLTIIIAAMGALNPEKSKKVEINPKLMKIALSASLVLIISGMITFFLVV